RPAADAPLPAPGQIVAIQSLEQFARGGQRQWLALVRPIFQRDEAPRLVASRVERRKFGELAHRALRVQRPEAGLQDLDRQGAEPRRSRLALLPQLAESRAGLVRIARKVPGRG